MDAPAVQSAVNGDVGLTLSAASLHASGESSMREFESGDLLAVGTRHGGSAVATAEETVEGHVLQNVSEALVESPIVDEVLDDFGGTVKERGDDAEVEVEDAGEEASAASRKMTDDDEDPHAGIGDRAQQQLVFKSDICTCYAFSHCVGSWQQ